MRTLRMQVLLPLTQFVVAVTMLAWGHGARAPLGLDTVYVPTVTLVCKAANAPALLFKVLGFVQFLPIFRGRAPLSVFGFDTSEMLFLMGVIVLWSIIAKVVDRGRSANKSQSGRFSAARVTTLLFLMTFGTWLFIAGALPAFRNPGLYNNPTGNFAQGCLFLVWSLVLVIPPGIVFAREIRRKFLPLGPTASDM
jgi:hypothetical protein